MSPEKNPSEVADKWVRRSTGAVEDYKKGVQSVTESPTKKAASKKEKFQTNLNKAIDEGKWEEGLNAVSLEEWKEKTSEKGGQRYAGGIRAAESKMLSFLQQLLPYQATLQAKINAMPDITLEDSIARMSEWARGMAKFKRKRS